jgi:squalene-hopene/tetraprenyl-beta-curcumene cyclase
MIEKGARWLAQSQNRDGGWGGGPGLVSSVEETALALEALVDAHRRGIKIPPADLPGAVAWLVERVESNTWREPAPLGFYFARLWYFERLYPLIFTVSALRTVRENLPSTGR